MLIMVIAGRADGNEGIPSYGCYVQEDKTPEEVRAFATRRYERVGYVPRHIIPHRLEPALLEKMRAMRDAIGQAELSQLLCLAYGRGHTKAAYGKNPAPLAHDPAMPLQGTRLSDSLLRIAFGNAVTELINRVEAWGAEDAATIR